MKRAIISVILSFSALALQAKIFLATDKRSYLAGETICCSVFSDGRDAVAYIELTRGELPDAVTKIALMNGRGGGFLNIPSSCLTGNYCLRVYDAGGSFEQSVVSVFNVHSSLRVKDGVKVVTEAPVVAENTLPSSYGLKVVRDGGGKLELYNDSKDSVGVCVSVRISDCISASERRHCIEDMYPSGLTAAGSVEYDGEIIRAEIAGENVGDIDKDGLTAILSSPLSMSSIYTAGVSESGSIEFHTENIYGDGDVVCMLEGVPDGKLCHIELVRGHHSVPMPELPVLELWDGYEESLLRRASVIAVGRTDTLFNTLPVRREHFFLDAERTRICLDDYKRFPTMEEEFVEIIKNIRTRRTDEGGRVFSLMLDDERLSPAPVWGEPLVLLDGVPIVDHTKIWNYDPSLVGFVDIYRHSYCLGDRTYPGIVNFITKKGNLPSMKFDDNVRIYSFTGCSYPGIFRGGDSLYWNPLITLAPGERITLEAAHKNQPCIVEITGLTCKGVAVNGAYCFD